MTGIRRVGVVGAGTMGAGIAQLAAQAGARTLVHDPDTGALERGLAGIARRLDREVEKGRMEAGTAEEVKARLEPAAALTDLAPCGLVIEAAPERLALKRELWGQLDDIVGQDCVLATNTSSLPVTAMATGSRHPERVVGMHFFNPAPLMKLVEIIAGADSSEAALAVARETGAAMKRRVIDATDGPGFLVNRCNRPFGLEALRLLQERVATVEQIDRIVRLGGSFRMGPFELQDLVGIDVGFAVSKSFYELSFGEPRWRPSPLTAQMVGANRHGRKTGRGWYEYPADGSGHRPEDPPAPAPGGGDSVVIVAGETVLAEELRAAASAAGWDVRVPATAAGDVAFLIVDCGASEDEPEVRTAPFLHLCDVAPLNALDPGGAGAGFFALPPFGESGLVELTRSATTADATAAAAEHFFATLGKHTEWVGDAPGLVLGRIVCQIVNECCFAVGEGVGSPEDVDAGMVLGLNQPRGPLEWADHAGAETVLGVLTGLQEEYGEERYRPAPVLVRAVRTDTPLRAV